MKIEDVVKKRCISFFTQQSKKFYGIQSEKKVKKKDYMMSKGTSTKKLERTEMQIR